MITKEQAIELKHGDIIHDSNKNSDGTCRRWKVNGKVKTWKREKSKRNKFEVPLKHGLYNYGYLASYNNHWFHLIENCENERG